MFLSTLDSGIINIAIPSLLKVFNSHISIVIWTVTLYTLALSASILFFGRFADRVGRLHIYTIGLVLFALSSLLCGLSPTIWLLIIFRAVQGISAAMMQATSMALITTRLSGKEMAKAMGIFGMLIGLGPLMGPVAGGFILSMLGWQWIFWINIPICLLGLYGCKKLTPAEEELHQKPIHFINLILIGISMLLLLLTMSFIGQGNHLWILSIITTIMISIIYFYSKLKTKHPIIQLSLFKYLKFSAPILGIIAFGGASALAFMLPPLYFEKLKGLQAWQVGLISLSAPIGLVIAARVATKFVESISTLLSMLIGISVMVISLLALTQIQIDWPVPWVFVLLLAYGIGGGLYQTPCYINLTSQFLRDRQAFISSLIRMVQNLAIVFEAAGAAMLISIKSKKRGGGEAIY